MQFKLRSDVLIIGGGIIGASIARQIAKVSPHLRVNLIEKEKDFGIHTSTKNSGVIHGGLYYKSNSLKAKHCVRGNQLLTEFHKERKLPLIECGKLILAKNAEEYQKLKELQNQATINGVYTELISQPEALKLEPKLRVYDDFQVLFCPSTKAGHPVSVLSELIKDLHQCSNVTLFSDAAYSGIMRRDENYWAIKAHNQNNIFEARVIINCAGLYADKIAKDFGVGTKYALIPLKGLYLIDKKSKDGFKRLVYPVPPVKGSIFLGVHTTITHSGELKLGPTAMPAFWRENYSGFKNFKPAELLETLVQYLRIGMSSKFYDYFTLLVTELKKHDKKQIIKDAQRLVHLFEHPDELTSLSQKDIDDRFEFGKVAIRSQLIDISTKEFLTDFLIEEFGNTIHLLNIASPGWTSALSLAEEVSDRTLKLLSGSQN